MGGQVIRMHFWSLEFENANKRTWHCRGCDNRVTLDELHREDTVNPRSAPTLFELTLKKIERSCPRTAKPERPRVLRETTHLVVIAREGVPEVTEFSSYEEASQFFGIASANWSESYLTLVVAGPGKPLPSVVNPHCSPHAVALRKARGAALCIDEDCSLSGGYAHVGPCEPCNCPLQHATDECPERGRFP